MPMYITVYLLILFVACILGSIYSQIKCLHSLRSLYFRPQGLASIQSCYILLALTYNNVVEVLEFLMLVCAI